MTAAAASARDDADRHAGERARDEIFDGQARAVDAEAEIGGMAERQNAGVAEQEIERHRGQRHDEDARAELGIAADRMQPKGHGQQQEPR